MLGLTRTSRARSKTGVPPPEAPSPEARALVMKRARGLARELKRKVRGEVRFDDGSRALYASDLSLYRQVPIGVVIPRDMEDVLATVAACRERDLPILGRGSGTSLLGQCCNLAVIIDFSKYIHRILEVNPGKRYAWVEPGVICDQLRDATAPHQLAFAPDPATHAYCTLGGMIGNNSCGAHSVMGGRTSDNVEELDFLTYDGQLLRLGRTSDEELARIIELGGRRGELYAKLRALRDRYADEIRRRYPHIPRRVSGYNLDELLPEKGFHLARAVVGSESTLGLVLRARVRLIHSPPKRALLVIGYPSPYAAGDAVPEVRELEPLALEAFHVHVVENMRRKGRSPPGAELLPEGRTWLLVEFGGNDQAEANARAHEARARLEARGGFQGLRLVEDAKQQTQLWELRESGVGASRVPGSEDAWPGWEDSAVPPEKLGDYLRELVALFERYHFSFTLFGHFGQGCVHSRIAFDTQSAAGVKAFRSYMEEAANLVVRYGGSLSGEHGDGQAHGEQLPKMFGPELIQAFREFKSIWDPHWRMNPGKVVDAYPLDQNLRVGPYLHTRQVQTWFQYPEDRGSFAQATERCFGVGKCRRTDGGTMCPSFMVTREEKHTTRGRAHLLFEMLRGDAVHGGWRDENVKESLDLCLACKGCKGECPVNVDMATYKAEFLAHYHEHVPRPRTAYSLGLVFRWARLASRMPVLANLLTQVPLLSRVAKSLAGVAPERELPAVARRSFKQWFDARPVVNPEGPPVILWPDTFNNYFEPNTARAAVEVLEEAGYRVEVPAEPLCCGRPLYDFGMLEQAKRQLLQVLEVLRPSIRAGVPVVALEPSCGSVFTDELVNLFPNDEDARRLKQQTFLFGDFLEKEGYVPPRLERKAVLHGHCHHKSLVGLSAEETLLKKAGLEVDTLDSGCCGMAGSFGFEPEKYALSMKIGERKLLPAVRDASEDTLVVADGFSCRTQIEHGSHRRALHLAEVLRMARREGPQGPAGHYPELAHVQARPSRLWLSAGAVLLVGMVGWGLRRWRTP